MAPLEVLEGITWSQPAMVLVYAALGLLAVYWYGTYKFSLINRLNVPGPKPWPFVGNIPDIYKYGGTYQMFKEYMKRYGKVFYVSFGRVPSLVVADPEILKQILVKEFSKFRNRKILFKQQHPMNKGLFSNRDDGWKKTRSILTPVFSASKLKQMVPLIEESCEILVNKFSDLANSGMAVDVRTFYQKYSLEVIMSTSFGIKTNIQQDEDNEISRRTTERFKSRASLLLYIQALPFQPLVKKIFSMISSAGFVYFRDIASQIISQRKEQGIENGRKDLIYLLLKARDESGNKLAEDEIPVHSVSFLLAGLHTTSLTLTGTTYHLALNPDVQEKLAEEIQAAQHENPDKPLYDLVTGLEYLDCVLKEVLRCGGESGTSLNRECAESCTINGIYFPAGIEVILPFKLIHNDPDAWPEPLKFDPERHRGPAKDQRHPYQYNPFGVGPRNCIGMRFALLEVKLTIARLLSDFKLVWSPENMGAMTPSEIPPQTVHIKVEKRMK